MLYLLSLLRSVSLEAAQHTFPPCPIDGVAAPYSTDCWGGLAFRELVVDLQRP